jgi:phospholipid/cholesterol/gamma-HCH transport system substrate-binding protein
VFTLGGQQKTFQKSITLRAIFDDVQGLQKGNNVWFSGVKIGTIKRISFLRNSQVEVDISIEEKAREYIRKDAKARISSEGFIGNKLIVLDGGSATMPAVEDGDIVGVEKTLSTDDIMNTLQANNRNLLDITTDFKTVSKRLTNGEGTVGKLLTDETVLRQLEQVMTTLRRAAANTEQLTASFSNYAAKLNTRGSLANELVTDTVLYARLRATAAQIDDLSRTANSVVADLKNASTSLNTSLSSPNTPAGVLLNDEAAAANLKATLRNLNTGTRKLDQNMEALQHNFLLRGFFRRNKDRLKDTTQVTE